MTYLLSDKAKKIFLHKDREHSTMKKETAAEFSQYDEAFFCAQKMHLENAFSPIKSSEVK